MGAHSTVTAPEDLGKYKDYKNPSARGEQKHWDEVGLCKCADLVVAVGPKLEKAYFSYLQGYKKGEDIFGLIPGLFDREFGDIVQMPKTKNDDFKVLLCGRGDNEDFELKGYNIAVKAFADPRLKGKSYHLVFVGAPDGMEDEVRKRLVNHGITEEQLTVRKFVQCRGGMKDLLWEVDLAIMPSKSEGFGLVALEALSAGLPVLVGSNSGFASAIRDLPLGAYGIVDSVDPAKWAEAIKDVCVRHGVRIDENKILREHYGKKYVWKRQCKALVERLSGMISDDQGASISQGLAADDSMGQQTVVIPEGTSGKELSKFGETSTAPDQAVAAINLGEQRPSSVSESVSYPDASTIQHIVGDAVSQGRENVLQEESPRTYSLTTIVGKQRLNPGILEISSEGRSVQKQGRRPLHLHPNSTPPVMEQRHDTDIRRGTSTSQALAADDSMEQETVVIPEGTSRGTQSKQPATKPTRQDSLFTSKHSEFAIRSETCVEPTQSGISYAVSPERQSAEKQERRPSHFHLSASPPSKKQRRDTDIFRVFTHYSVVVKLLRAEYNRRAHLRPLFWDNTIQLPLEKVYTRLKIVSRQKSGDQTKPKRRYGSLLPIFWPYEIEARERAEEVDSCDIFGLLKKGGDIMTIIEGSPGIGKTTLCLKLAYDWANQGSSAASCPEFELVLLLKCRDIDGDLTEAITEQLFPKDMRYTEGDSFEYIRRHFKIAGREYSSKGEKLIEEIKENALLQDLLTNPLNLLLLCVVYEDHEGELPSSRTDLYHVIVVCLLRRYCAKYNVKASKKDRDLETKFERDMRCLGKLAWNCLLNDRHSFSEEELEELESRHERLVVRELGFVYKEEGLKRLKPQHVYCFLHKSFQEYLAASYIAHKLRRNEFNVFEHLNFNAVVNKFRQVFVFVCGILREEASILFAQIGEKLKRDWDWLECSEAAANFFIDSWSESGNAEGMANTLCSFMPFPRVIHLIFDSGLRRYESSLLKVLLFCRRFSMIEAPDEIYLKFSATAFVIDHSFLIRQLKSLPNLKSVDLSGCYFGRKLTRSIFGSVHNFASLTELALRNVSRLTDWKFLAEALTISKTLERVGFVLMGERGEGWARALDAGLCADTPLSSVSLTICGGMSETALQALENLLLNKSLSSLSVIVEGELSHSLAVSLSRALTGQTAVKSLDLRVNGKLSFCCANLMERCIVKNNSLNNFVLCLHGEVPDNWQVIVENLNVQLAEKSTVTFEIYPNTLSQVTATQLTDFRPCVIKYGLFEQENVTLNVWGELSVDGAEALYNILPCTWVCCLMLNIHGKLTDDFLHCTARHVDKQKPLCPITINAWDQLTNDGEALFKELELDKNPAVTLNVCEVHVPSDELGDNKIVSIDNPAALIALFEEAEKTGKENLTVTINVQSDDPTCDDSDDSTSDDSDDSTSDDSDDSIGRSWSDSMVPCLPRNCSLNSLTLTINYFSPKSTEWSFTLISFLESCISLKLLNLTLNECNGKRTGSFVSRLREGLGRNTSLISLTLTLNIYTRPHNFSSLDLEDIPEDDVVPNISINSFTLTINNFSITSYLRLSSAVLLSNYMSLNTFNLTINNWDEVDECDASCDIFLIFLNEVMTVTNSRTLRLKINDLRLRSGEYPKYDFSKLAEKSPSLELIELTICRYGDVCSWLETLKWEKQRRLINCSSEC
ncbi:PREDICTED: uncharacterized protein LOC107348570 [Acropora digitifera]|uniref:uncharacterized protein LOC107348570 n=1 Tax=Acropora digitifera TaxID=70779 RepID=UPI00077A32E3|nr:PREDICTED: uncharacterized protein LOC107348570 [Acropora digitifera]